MACLELEVGSVLEVGDHAEAVSDVRLSPSVVYEGQTSAFGTENL